MIVDFNHPSLAPVTSKLLTIFQFIISILGRIYLPSFYLGFREEKKKGKINDHYCYNFFFHMFKLYFTRDFRFPF